MNEQQVWKYLHDCSQANLEQAESNVAERRGLLKLHRIYLVTGVTMTVAALVAFVVNLWAHSWWVTTGAAGITVVAWFWFTTITQKNVRIGRERLEFAEQSADVRRQTLSLMSGPLPRHLELETTRTPTTFEQHLDGCRQCREHPFALCHTGATLLREER